MPPRKRPRGSAASTPLHETQPKAPAMEYTPALPKEKTTDQSIEDILNDPWTDEQTTALYKAVVSYPPKGMHRHFRMLSISTSLSSQGYTSDSAPHLSIPGIWAKLEKDFNLAGADERENESMTFLDIDPTDAAECPDFAASVQENEELRPLLWQRVFCKEGSASPPHTDLAANKDTPPPIGYKSQVPAEVIEEDQTPEPAKKGTKATRGKNMRATKAVQIRRGQKEQSVVSSSVADEDDEEEEEESGEDDTSTVATRAASSKTSKRKNPPKLRKSRNLKPKPTPKRARATPSAMKKAGKRVIDQPNAPDALPAEARAMEEPRATPNARERMRLDNILGP